MYSVNNDALDTQHKSLFDMFNRLYGSLVRDNDDNAYDTVLNDLTTYLNNHCAIEEQLMKDTKYINIDKHIREHEKYKLATKNLKNSNNSDKNELSRELLLLIGNIILHHVIEEDRKYVI